MKLSHQQELEALLALPSYQRETAKIEALLPWLRKLSVLFHDIDHEQLVDVIRNCEYKKVEYNDVLIKQGDVGDRMYVIVKGSVSIFARDDTKSPDGDIIVHLDDETSTTKRAVVIHGRSRFGKWIASLDSGKSVGEFALLSEDGIRSASVITDEPTSMILINQELYNTNIKAYHENEHAMRRQFVDGHVLFSHWLPRTRNLLQMCFAKEHYTYNETIVRQGEPANSLIFITKGQAKVIMEPKKHIRQFAYIVPELSPVKTSLKSESFHSRSSGRYSTSSSITQMKRDNDSAYVPRHKRTYVEAERLQVARQVEVCSVHHGEMIGAIENVTELPSVIATYLCTEPTEIYRVLYQDVERLLFRRHAANASHQTLTSQLRERVTDKLRIRCDSPQGARVPLLGVLLERMRMTEQVPHTESFIATRPAGVSSLGAIGAVLSPKASLFRRHNQNQPLLPILLEKANETAGQQQQQQQKQLAGKHSFKNSPETLLSSHSVDSPNDVIEYRDAVRRESRRIPRVGKPYRRVTEVVNTDDSALVKVQPMIVQANKLPARPSMVTSATVSELQQMRHTAMRQVRWERLRRLRDKEAQAMRGYVERMNKIIPASIWKGARINSAKRTRKNQITVE